MAGLLVQALIVPHRVVLMWPIIFSDSEACLLTLLSQVILHFLSQGALLWAILVSMHVAYSSKKAAQVYVTPAYLLSQMARSFIRISDRGWDPGSYVAWIEPCITLLLTSIREAHWLALLNSCIMCYLTITPLEGVMALSHIQISTSDVLSKPSSSCWMAAGTPFVWIMLPLGEHCHYIGGCPILDLEAWWPL